MCPIKSRQLGLAFGIVTTHSARPAEAGGFTLLVGRWEVGSAEGTPVRRNTTKPCSMLRIVIVAFLVGFLGPQSDVKAEKDGFACKYMSRLFLNVFL